MKNENLLKPLALLLTLSLLLSACGTFAASGDKSESDAYYFGETSGSPVVADSFAEQPQADFAADSGFAAEEGARSADLNATKTERLVIKNADIAIVVDKPEDVIDEIAELAENLGGFVVSSNLYQSTNASGVQFPGASITIRVPAESLQDALAQIEEKAVRVDHRSQSGQDVTAQYTDLQSRLRNLEDAEELLRQIMDEARDTEDVLNAFNQLNYITEQIEVLKGQIQYFEESAALSAISVQLIASAADQPITIGGWEPVGVAKDAIQALVNAFQALVNALIWIALYLLPILLVIGVPLFFLLRGLRRWWAKREKPKKADKK
ncbi:MAG: DUF4349 domain-containing protein [Chloroflexi bacterium]|nr:DUF4349 domain-containing protein [Chloroflexota bacterium]